MNYIMRQSLRTAALSCLALGLASSASAQSPSEVDYFKASKPVTIEADKGYILVRHAGKIKNWVAPFTLIRKLKPEEITAYEAAKKAEFADANAKNEEKRAKRLAAKAKADAKGKPYTKSIPAPLNFETFTFPYEETQNVYGINTRKEYEKDENGRVMLFSIMPGTYVVADIGGVCMCMGTVQFDVKPGEIVDMGLMMSDKAGERDAPSVYPELEPIVKDHGKYKTGFWFLESAIRPYNAEMYTPAALAEFPRKPANYQAMGKMPVYFSTMISRLAPIPGVLDYDKDIVINAKTGERLK